MQELKFFLVRNGCGTLLMEQNATKSLRKDSLNFLGDKLVEFIEKKYNNGASKSQITKVCEHAIKIFKCLECTPSKINGIVSQFNL